MNITENILKIIVMKHSDLVIANFIFSNRVVNWVLSKETLKYSTFYPIGRCGISRYLPETLCSLVLDKYCMLNIGPHIIQDHAKDSALRERRLPETGAVARMVEASVARNHPTLNNGTRKCLVHDRHIVCMLTPSGVGSCRSLRLWFHSVGQVRILPYYSIGSYVTWIRKFKELLILKSYTDPFTVLN